MLVVLIFNHNYFLADRIHRATGKRPLIPHYQLVIIDEAHKFLQAARSMYGIELTDRDIPPLAQDIHKFTMDKSNSGVNVHKLVKKLKEQSVKLFRRLNENIPESLLEDDEADRFPVVFDDDITRHLKSIGGIAADIADAAVDSPVHNRMRDLRSRVLWKLSSIGERISGLRKFSKNIYWLENRLEGEIESQALCSIPKDLDVRLYNDLWSSGIPIVLTSGTLSAGGHISSSFLSESTPALSSKPFVSSFTPSSKSSDSTLTPSSEPSALSLTPSHSSASSGISSSCHSLSSTEQEPASQDSIYAVPTKPSKSDTLELEGDFTRAKETLGLNHLPDYKLYSITKPSPFDFKNNAMIYISENVPFPDNKDKRYIKAVADEIERLVIASHGHAAVLFTSYNAMGQVHAILKKRSDEGGLCVDGKPPFPLFRLERGSTNAIEQFKKSGKGILLASGALWEGIDIPGDTLSMLIIVKLPFAVPDPIGDYERELCGNMETYKARAVIPDMLVKLKQGFGRLIRKMGDTGVVAILDIRVSERGAYREKVLSALPGCVVTSFISKVVNFFRIKKSSKYFE